MRNGLSLSFFTKSFCITLLFAALLLVTFADVARAQQTTSPDRGFQPGGAYAAGNIETISATNGNLTLSVPLAGLPPGRGGLSPKIGLVYNSKLWDSSTEYDNCPWVSSGKGFLTVNAQYPTCSGDATQRSDYLRLSSEGGWHYGLRYKFRVQYSAYRGHSAAPVYNCAGSNLVDVQLVKLLVVYPDGGTHEFRLAGKTEPDSQQPNFFPVYPDGTVTPNSSCDGWTAYTGPVTYYSTDGTYARLVFDHDGNQEASDNTWTLYLADGTRVTGGTTSSQPQRVYDRNNNYLEVSNTTYNGHTAEQIVDQFGRSLILEYGSATDEDSVHAWGFDHEEAVWKVRWRSISPGNSYLSGVHGLTGYAQQDRVVDRVILPNASGETAERAYVFGYNVDAGASPRGWGEVNSVTLPTGAQAKYQYTMDGVTGMSATASKVLKSAVKRKDLIYQREYDGNAAQVTETWLYSINQPVGTTTITAPDGGMTKQSFYSPSQNQAWNDSLVYRSESPDGSVVERDWRHNTPRGMTAFDKVDNSYVKTEFTSVRDATGALTKTVIRDYAYDKNGNPTSVREYDWAAYASYHDASGNPLWTVTARPTLKRETATGYYNDTPDASDSLAYDADAYSETTAPLKRDSAMWTEVRDDTRALSRAELTYDDPATKGNMTATKTWDSAKGVYSNPLTSSNSVSASAQYDAYGNTVLVTDAGGHSTRYTYGAVNGFSDLYPTVTEVAFGTAVQRTSTTQYDFSTGLPTLVTDADNGVSTSTTYDVFGRPTLVVTAPGTTEETQTATFYSDSGRRVVVRSDINGAGDGKLVSIKHYDQLGRVRLVRTLEDATPQGETDETAGVKVQTRYAYGDPTGDPYNYTLVSNPYRAAYSSAAGSELTMGWSRTKADRAGRVVEVQKFAGSGLPAPWGANSAGAGRVTTAYDAEYVTVTDQAMRPRRSAADALGRLVRVDEPVGSPNPDGTYNLGPKTGPLQPTSYTYDALGNLRKVEQGGQLRFFMYDSRSRLVRVKNPEQGSFATDAQYFPAMTDTTPGSGNSQWSVGYLYDADGNLTKRKDARNLTTTYGYDALDRNVSITYGGAAPDVTLYYDGAIGGKGQLWKTETSGVTAAVFDKYDVLGRPTQYHQSFWVNSAWGQPFTVTRSYDRAGHVVSQTYPSGRTVSYTYDPVGRLASFTGTLGDGVQRTYSTGVTYAATGGIQQEQFGTATPLYNKRHYNARGQLYDTRLSSVSWATDQWNWNRGALLNYYSAAELTAATNAARALSGTDNNGNLKRAGTYIPLSDTGVYTEGNNASYVYYHDDYDYDALNRLSYVAETAGGTGVATTTPFKQTYTYDRFGNRTINSAQTSGVAATQFELQPQANQEVAEPSNRLYAPGDSARAPSQKLMRYDAAGNLVYDSYTGQGARVYDAENRMTQAQDVYQQWSTYTYDGGGHRVKRLIANQETWQVYGPGGELLAEYQAGSAPMTSTKEYGYRGGELLVTMSSGDDQRLKRFVTNLYYGALHRDPTASELQDASNQLITAAAQGGQPQLLGKAKQVARALFTQTSYETLTPAKTDAQYISDLYYVYMQRAADDSGLGWWVSQLASKGRSGVCDDFQNSIEFDVLVTTLYGNASSDNQRAEKFVTNFYLGAYGRFPTQPELQQQRDALNAAAAQGQSQVQAQAETMGRAMFAAQAADLSLPAEQFVINLYEGFLQRGPDAGGLSFWTGQAGTSVAARQEVLNKFAISNPFREFSGTLYREAFWLVSDHLGTPRIIVDKSGSFAGMKRHDYLPFGDEIAAGVGNRTPQQGYADDAVRQQFTGYERDDETRLDFAQARYYAPAQGRFTSVDPLLASANSNNPQSFNRYTYVLNNPLAYVDRTGAFPEFTFSVYVRAFAPFRWFGPGRIARGDDRGFSTDPNSSYRIQGYSEITATGDGSDYPMSFSRASAPSLSETNLGFASWTAFSECYINDPYGNYHADGVQDTNTLTEYHLYGNDDAIPFVSSNIDLHVGFTYSYAEQGDGAIDMHIMGSVTGDQFPAAEAFIRDSGGNSVMLGVFAPTADSGPGTSLPFDATKPMINVNVTVRVNNGVFQGVVENGNVTPLDQYNRRFTSQPAVRPSQ